MGLKPVAAFGEIRPRRILVVGDLILDRYTIGTIQRISPEAPVPVLNPRDEQLRPGGAGNAALNLRALGQEVRLLARVGQDDGGESLRTLLDESGVDLSTLLTDPHHPTPVKTRLIAGGQQLLRVDAEEIGDCTLPVDLEAALSDIDAVAVSDYGKGFCTPPFLAVLIAAANARDIPLIVDPKGRDFTRYRGATLIKPNQSEAFQAAGIEGTLDEVAGAILTDTETRALVITRSEKGISLFTPDTRQDFPTEVHEVRDVTGAGDTVLAILATALANRLDLPAGVQLANVAASLAVQRFGCAHISLQELAAALLHRDQSDKVFDQRHLTALQSILEDRPFSLLHLSPQPLTSALFTHLQTLGEGTLVIYLDRDDPLFVQLLSSLDPIDYILLCPESVAQLTPSATYALDGDQLLPLAAPASV